MPVDTFFLYSNTEIAYSYMSGRQIATSDLLPTRSFSSRSLSHINDHLIFLTHKKLDISYRTYGMDIEGDYQISPIVLRFVISSAYNQPAWLLSLSAGGKVKVEQKKLSLYKPDKHFGAFVTAELPMSLVSSYLFESIENIISFSSRPSPDLWFPRRLFCTLKADEFVDKLPCELSAICNAVNLDNQVYDSISMAGIRSRIRAMMWSSFHAIGWESNNFRYTIDPIVQDAFGISDDAINKLIPEYASSKNEKYQNKIVPWNFDYSKILEQGCADFGETVQTTDALQPFIDTFESTEAKLFALILKQFVKTRADLLKPNDYWDSILPVFTDEASRLQFEITGLMRAFVDCLYTKVGCMNPEQYSKAVPSNLYPLTSLLFVARNSNSLEQLILDLKEYHANLLVTKTARLLWSFLNGMFDVPGEDYQKDNPELWQKIEEAVSLIAKDEFLYSFKKMASPKLTSGNLFGQEIKSDRMASIKGIQRYFIEQVSNENEQAIQACYRLLSGVVDCSKIAFKAKNTVSIEENAELSPDEYQRILSSFEQISTPDREKILNVLKNTELFRDICKRNSTDWKTAYIQHIENAMIKKEKAVKRRKRK